MNRTFIETKYFTGLEIHLIDVFVKGEKENLSPKERNDIKKLVTFIKNHG